MADRLGLPKGNRSAVTGVSTKTGRVGGGAITPSAKKALYPGGKATNPRVASVSAIPAASPKTGRRPSIHPVQRP